MAVEKTGDWEKFGNLLANASANLKKNIKSATDKAGRLIEERIVKRIQSNQVQPPTGLESKEWKERHGYSDTTLIMTSSLINAIKYENKDWNEGFVGVKRTAAGRPGTELVNIAALHEEYGVITKWGGRKKRPFIAPAAEQVKRKIGDFYEKAVEESFK